MTQTAQPARLAMAPASSFANTLESLSSALKIASRNRLAIVGAIIILVTIAAAILGPFLMPYDPHETNVRSRLQGPSWAHWMGTDRVGRDIFSRILAGLSLTMQVAFGAVAFGIALGVPLGSIAGYAGRWVDSVIMRVMDGLMAFPSRLLAIALVAAQGASIFSLWIAIGFTSLPRYARIIRGGVLSQKQREYVEAARAIGENPVSILVRYILPNSIAPLSVQITLDFAHAILVESSLSFLGLGMGVPSISWGLMLAEAQTYMEFAPWTAVFPGMAIFLVVLGFNLLGDGLRDIFDPRQHRR